MKYIVCIFSQRRHSKYGPQREAFRIRVRDLDTADDWFTGKIPSWLDTFDRYSFRNRKDLHGLEIGAHHGMSAIFLLEELPNASIVCVDTWQGQSSNDDGDSLSDPEDRFDLNTAHLADRITKFKGSSFSFFERHREIHQFDFIYVDGSHLADDVILDAVMGFAMLRPGGVMIFDDFLYGLKRYRYKGPAAAINAFLRLKRGQYDLIHVGDQVQIRKRVL